MRRVMAILVCAGFVAGCGGGDDEPASSGTSAAGTDGKALFNSNCASCHKLADAGATTGRVGPDLDAGKPDEATVARQVTNGGGGMPAFGDTLSKEQIDAIAAYVSRAAGS